MTLLAGGLAFLMPIFVLGLVRLRVLTSRRLRQNRRIAFVVLLVFAILLPTVDPVSLAFEVVPLVSSSSCRSGSPCSWSAAGIAAGTRSSPRAGVL